MVVILFFLNGAFLDINVVLAFIKSFASSVFY
jgi:hypothetical protein